MDEYEGGPVEPGELEKKFNDLVQRLIVDKNFANSLNDPEQRADAMRKVSFTDEEIENLGPGFDKVSVKRLIDRTLSVEDIISRFTPSEKDPNTTSR